MATFTFNIAGLKGTFTHHLLLVRKDCGLFTFKTGYLFKKQRFVVIPGYFALHNLVTEPQLFAGTQNQQRDNINHIARKLSNFFRDTLHKHFACANLPEGFFSLTLKVKKQFMHPEITYDDLDWHTLWQNARAQKSWTAKGPADWDKKAFSFAKRNSDSPFVNRVLQHIPVTKSTTILDAGSGPGTLSLPLASRVDSITAIDYSEGMLATLNDLAREQGSTNIRTVLGSWEDDWEKLNIERHDICIASRSLSVANLQSALAKLHYYANDSVFVVDRINPTPFDNGAFTALGRPFRSGPDYIYTINTLYSMGIHPNVDVISLEKTVTFSSMDTALESYRWMFKDLTREDERKLAKYIQDNSRLAGNGEITINRQFPSRWALIWWKTGN